jgi:hypothetical protein
MVLDTIEFEDLKNREVEGLRKIIRELKNIGNSMM